MDEEVKESIKRNGEECDLSNKGINDTQVKEVMEILNKYKTTLRVINLYGNKISKEGVIYIANGLLNTDVYTLHLGRNNIGDDGIMRKREFCCGNNGKVFEQAQLKH